MASKTPMQIMSDDPEVMALQGMVKGLVHMTKKELEPADLKVLAYVEIMKKALKIDPTIQQLQTYIGVLDEKQVNKSIGTLVTYRYLTEKVPTFGEIRYGVGPVGATVLGTMLGRKGRRKKD